MTTALLSVAAMCLSSGALGFYLGFIYGASK